MVNQAITQRRPQVLLSLRDAAIDLGCHRVWLKGFCDGRGIRLVEVGAALCLTRRDLERVRRWLAARTERAAS